MPPRDDAPRITEEDREVMEHPEEGFDPDKPPEEIERALDHQVNIVERDNEWIDRRSASAGRTSGRRGRRGRRCGRQPGLRRLERPHTEGAVRVAATRLVDRDDLPAKREQPDRDELEIRQPERDPDDRQALQHPGDEVAEGEPPAARMNHMMLPMPEATPAPGRLTRLRPNGQSANRAMRSAAMPNGIVMIRMKQISAARV